ncbi:MAG: hypothetical protein OQJ87_05710 [Rhodospirillales bacterium]|nr:hypothetical protein [Rhodospirillales bacterium]MCW8952465.1 hypothetical protein [Rhodospirillales bacterium]MCW9002196.1 hypothetical protein [Rhodospirillales bacterium]MCW9040838.1 hypothetical protein [Rhodospirillales bacterium]
MSIERRVRPRETLIDFNIDCMRTGAERLHGMIENQEGFDSIYDLFCSLRGFVLESFRQEEAELMSLPDVKDEVSAHVLRHTKTHTTIRGLLRYCDDKFKAPDNYGSMPPILVVVRDVILRAIRDEDSEMMRLFDRLERALPGRPEDDDIESWSGISAKPR